MLEQIADQVSAQPQIYHAVYQSKYLLKDLASALARGADYQDLGWTNVLSIPQPTMVNAAPENLPDLGSSNFAQPHSLSLTITNDDPSSPEAQRQIEQQLANVPAMMRPMLRAKIQGAMASALKNVNSNPAPVTQMAEDAGHVMISAGDPVLLEAGLINQFNDLAPSNHQSPEAIVLAKALNCKSATLYLLQATAPGDLMGHHLPPRLFTVITTNGGPPQMQTSLADQLSAAVQRDRADEMISLSPEERVIRARHHQTKTNN